jgi:polysaccharide export outer membrane protein
MPPLFAVVRASGLALLCAACASVPTPAFEPFSPRPQPTAEFPDIAYADWSETEPEYRFFPGDDIDIVTPTAPELNRSLKVGPDGRIQPGLIGPIMAADRSPSELEAQLAAAYAPVLVRPDVQVVVRQTAPMRVYVGGEVKTPGEYEMPGDIDALQAVLKAGGFTTAARRFEVVVIRRGPDGRPMMKTVDLLRAAMNPGAGDAVPLRRFDIIYVPRTRIAEVGLFTQQYVNDAVPFSSGFGYILADRVLGRN